MSGGQQQRVALARALVNHPTVLLLDEPLGALDLKLRKEMQLELKALQREVGITFVYVTHDQEEALTMSDVIVVMRDGLIQQMGGPTVLYERPVNRFVADFIGTSNFIAGHDRLVDAGDRRATSRSDRGLYLRGRSPTRRPTVAPATGRDGRHPARAPRGRAGRCRPATPTAGRPDPGTDHTRAPISATRPNTGCRPTMAGELVVRRQNALGGGDEPGHWPGRPGRRALARGGEPGPRGLGSDSAPAVDRAQEEAPT